MQPKNDTSLAIGVTDIVKTLLSHPDHGMKPHEVAPLVKDIWRAFQEASQTSSGAIIAATTTAPAPARVEAPVATATAVAAEQAAPVAPPASPAPTKAKSRSKAREPKAEVVQTEPPAPVEVPETTAVVSETPVSEAPPKNASSRKKAAEPVAAVADAGETAVSEVVIEEAANSEELAPSAELAQEVVEEAPPPTPEELLEAKFGGKVTRNRWNNMDPADSIKHDVLICLIDGLPRKMLHRHLKARYNMEPEEYRAWLDLPADYPMTAPGYSKEKSDYAKVVGLGTAQFAEKTKLAGVEEPQQPVEDAKATPKTSRRTRKDSKQKGNARQRTTA